MVRRLAVVILFALCIGIQDAMVLPADDIFEITRASEIKKIGTTQKKFVFDNTMTYTFNARLSDNSFTLTMIKQDIPESTLLKTPEIFAFREPTVYGQYLSRQVAFYMNTEKTAFLAERCDAEANEGEGACVLIDLIYSCLPDDLCLRVFLRAIIIQKDESTDWSVLSESGNVDLAGSLPRCGALNTAGADGPFCFTRKTIQFGSIVEIRASGTFSSVCNNDTVAAAVFKDNHDGLSRLGALVVAVKLDSDVLTCTTSAEVNNTFRADDSQSTEPSDPTDYSITYTFSSCAVNIFRTRIEELNNQSSNCLLHGNLTDEQFFTLVNHRRLAGEIVALNHQCQLAFGVESYACDLYNSTSGLVIPNTAICGAGAFCTNNGTCGDNQTIVYSGTVCGTNKICYKGVCRADFDCGGLPTAPNGYYTSSGATGFLATADLNCFPGFNTMTNVTIKCLRTGWQSPPENCSAPVTTTTTTPSTTPTTSNFGIFPG